MVSRRSSSVGEVLLVVDDGLGDDGWEEVQEMVNGGRRVGWSGQEGECGVKRWAAGWVGWVGGMNKNIKKGTKRRARKLQSEWEGGSRLCESGREEGRG